MKRGFHGPNICFLCATSEESLSQILFAFNFSQKVLGPLKAWIKLNHVSLNLKQILWLLKRHFKGDNWRHKLAKLTINGAIYLIWGERNSRNFNGQFSTLAVLSGKLNFLLLPGCYLSRIIEMIPPAWICFWINFCFLLVGFLLVFFLGFFVPAFLFSSRLLVFSIFLPFE